MKKPLSIAAMIAAAILLCRCDNENNKQEVPLVAIINYGQIPPLLAAIKGIKKELKERGYTESQNVRYEIADIAFDHSLIPQTVTKVKSRGPKVIIVTGTPITQYAKGAIKDIALVYNAVTDPVDARLLDDKTKSMGNMTGSSDMQNLNALLTFVRSILPHARTIGLPYATSDSNDTSLINMMGKEAAKFGMSLVVVPIDQVRDIPIRMQELEEATKLHGCWYRRWNSDPRTGQPDDRRSCYRHNNAASTTIGATGWSACISTDAGSCVVTGTCTI